MKVSNLTPKILLVVILLFSAFWQGAVAMEDVETTLKSVTDRLAETKRTEQEIRASTETLKSRAKGLKTCGLEDTSKQELRERLTNLHAKYPVSDDQLRDFFDFMANFSETINTIDENQLYSKMYAIIVQQPVQASNSFLFALIAYELMKFYNEISPPQNMVKIRTAFFKLCASDLLRYALSKQKDAPVVWKVVFKPQIEGDESSVNLERYLNYFIIIEYKNLVHTHAKKIFTKIGFFLSRKNLYQTFSGSKFDFLPNDFKEDLDFDLWLNLKIIPEKPLTAETEVKGVIKLNMLSFAKCIPPFPKNLDSYEAIAEYYVKQLMSSWLPFLRNYKHRRWLTGWLKAMPIEIQDIFKQKYAEKLKIEKSMKEKKLALPI